MSKLNTFRDLQNSFETRSKPTTATTTTPQYRSEAGDLANMSPDKPGKSVPSIAKSLNSIDSVLDTSAAKPATRPLAKLRPSWIGPPRPERPATLGVSAMKQHVTIEYSSPGLHPPVYIFTSLSDPQWDPVEMQAEKKVGGEYKFSRAFDVEEGEYQYKFRLGPGDWWAFDTSKPTVDDGMGNKNNLLVVRLEQASVAKSTSPAPPAILLPKPALQTPAVMTPAPNEVSAPTPLMKHEAFDPNKGAMSQQTPERERENPLEPANEEGESQMLMKHETFAPNGKYDSSSGDEDEPHNSPLLRHESVVPTSKEQEHAPRFRHESIGIGYNHHEPAASHASPVKTSHVVGSPSSIPVEADPHDPSLEKFPTDHAGIIAKIHHTSTKLARDETTTEHSSPTSQALGETSPSLASVLEADNDEQLAKIREAEEEEFEREEQSGEEMDPLRPGAPMTPEPEDADFEPKVHNPEIMVIEKTVVVEVERERRRLLEILLEKLGGRGNAIAVAVGLLVVAAGIASMQLL